MPGKIKFQIVSASSQDENHKFSELVVRNPKAVGWQSSRFCLFPQEILIRLEYRARVLKIQVLSHHFLISSRIEIQVGDAYDTNLSLVPASLNGVRFRSLGSVDLNDNEKLGHFARELKSIHTDVTGRYVKLLLERNHYSQRNNPYNQVGLIAINVIGEEINEDEYRHEDMRDVSRTRPVDNKGWVRLDMMDDLEFDMTRDSEVTQIIYKLKKKKQEAVTNERYREARELSNTINQLDKVGKELGKLEVAKMQAVANEDYDEADRKKNEADELRRETFIRLGIKDSQQPETSVNSAVSEKVENRTGVVQRVDDHELKSPPIGQRKAVDTSSRTPPTSPRQQPMSMKLEAPPTSDSQLSSRVAYDERILPAVAKRMRDGEAENDTENQDKEYNENVQQQPKRLHPKPWKQPRQTKKTSAAAKAAVGKREEIREKQQTIQAATSEELEEGMLQMKSLPVGDKKEADLVVEAFGLPIAALLYLRSFKSRERGALAVDKAMLNLSPADTYNREKALLMLRASAVVSKRAIKDTVSAVLSAGLQLLKDILSKYLITHSIPRRETVEFLSDVLPHLIHRPSEENGRQTEAVKLFLIEASQYSSIAPLNIVTSACVEPLKQNVPPILSQRRADLVLCLFQQHGVANSGLTLENLMRFALSALAQTNSALARLKGEEIIVALYEKVGSPVRDLLPNPRTPRVKSNVLYKSLFDTLQEIDKRTGDKALPPHLSISTEGGNTARYSDEYSSPRFDATFDKNRKEDNFQGELRSLHETRRTAQSRFQDSKRMCVFCGESNDSYTEHALDRHYYFQCSMLIKCQRCKQIVETAELTKHRLVECEWRGEYERCARCTEAIHNSHYKIHTTTEICRMSDERLQHCPLCHEDFGKSGASNLDEQWRRHLMGRDSRACRENPRRKELGKGATTRRATDGGDRVGGVSRRPADFSSR